MSAISSNPATGFAFGAAGQYAFKGKSPESLYSSINGLGTNSPTGGALEYQFNLSVGIWGGVLFANVTSTTNPNIKEKLFTYFAPGYGFGLRLMVDKKSRTNLQIDVGFGKKLAVFSLGLRKLFRNHIRISLQVDL